MQKDLVMVVGLPRDKTLASRCLRSLNPTPGGWQTPKKNVIWFTA